MSWILQARQNAGYDMQSDFVQALAENGLHKSQNAVSMWETQGRLPTGIVGAADQLQLVAETLKMTPVEILRLSGHQLDLVTIGRESLSADVQDFLLEALVCTPEQLAVFLPKFTEMLRYTRVAMEHNGS